MPMSERHHARLRTALEAVLRAEDAVAEVADASARTGDAATDAALDAAATQLRQAGATLQRLLEGGGR